MGIEIFTMSTGGGGLLLVGGVPLSATLTAITDQFGNVSPLQIATASVRMTAPTFLTLPNWTNTLGSKDGFFASQSINVPSAGNGVFRMIRNDYTINNTAAQTGSVTGIFQNAIETNLNGITHNLIDLQVGGVSKFSVGRTGGLEVYANINFRGGAFYSVTTDTGINFNGAGIISLTTTGGFNRLQFGGTTNSFPAIKRNGANIDFVNAADSGYCGVTAINFIATDYLRGRLVSIAGIQLLESTAGNDFNRLQFGGTTNSFPAIKRALNNIEIKNADDSYGAGLSVGGLLVPSAILQADSTNKGFLMPRMAETQITAIASPADGLMIYNTTIQAPCFYNGLTMQWQKISHSIM